MTVFNRAVHATVSGLTDAIEHVGEGAETVSDDEVEKEVFIDEMVLIK